MGRAHERVFDVTVNGTFRFTVPVVANSKEEARQTAARIVESSLLPEKHQCKVDDPESWPIKENKLHEEH